MNYQNLFNALQNICGFIALQTDMYEIINAYEKDKAEQEKISDISGWVDVNSKLPDELETVFISNGEGWTSIGCLVYERDCGWHWAQTNGVIYEEDGKIISECDSDDLDVKFWHRFPNAPKK